MLGGCRSDMQDQPRLKPMRANEFRPADSPPLAPVSGTIARDDALGPPYLLSGFTGRQPGDTMPFPVDRAVLEHGRERFNIYCAPCHARTGDGNGMVVQRGFRRPPSYHIDRLRNAPLGHFFDVITNGFGAMPDYASQIPVHDRWAIAAYIRALQFSQYAPVALLPAGEKLPPAPLMPGTPGSGATPAQAEAQSGNLPAAQGPPSAVQRKAEQEREKRKQKERKLERK